MENPLARKGCLVMNERYDRDTIKLHANGQWHYILSYLCPELEQALQRPGHHTWCPVHHGTRGDAFRLFNDYEQTGGSICNTCGTKSDGFATIMWLTGWTFPETLKAVAQTIGVGNSDSYQLPPKNSVKIPLNHNIQEETELAERFCKSLNRTWNSSCCLDEPAAEPVRLYLASRGLTSCNLPSTLRYHPSLAYYDSDEGKITGYHPAMIGLVQDISGKPITLHRTYLTSKGHKAQVRSPKKIMSYPKIDRDMSGAAIRLSPAASVMGVTEGIETGLSVRQATDSSIWVAVSSTLLEVVQVPDVCTTLIAWADKDKPSEKGSVPGLDSAKKLVENQWNLGRKAGIVLPEIEGFGDWNDVLLQQGMNGFPKLDLLKQSARVA